MDFDNLETVAFRALGGTDALTVGDLRGTGVAGVDADLAARTSIRGAEQALDTLRLNTLAGKDDVTVAPGVADLIAPVVDLGPQ